MSWLNPWYKQWWGIGLLIVGTFLGLIIISLIATSKIESFTKNTDTKPQETITPDTIEEKIVETITNSDYDGTNTPFEEEVLYLNLTRWREYDSYEEMLPAIYGNDKKLLTNYPKNGKDWKFVKVEGWVTNRGMESYSTSCYSFKMKVTDGRSFDIKNCEGETKIQPGFKNKKKYYFEIPKDTIPTQLEIFNYDLDEKVYWELGNASPESSEEKYYHIVDVFTVECLHLDGYTPLKTAEEDRPELQETIDTCKSYSKIMLSFLNEENSELADNTKKITQVNNNLDAFEVIQKNLDTLIKLS